MYKYFTKNCYCSAVPYNTTSSKNCTHFLTIITLAVQ